MSVINSFVYKNIKLNYKRSIATIIGILLSVSLVCCIGSFVSSYYATSLNETISTDGYFHVKLSNLDNEQLITAQNNIKFNSTTVNNIGYGYIDSTNSGKPYVQIQSLESVDAFDEFKLELVEGRFATNSNEIVMSKHLISNGGNDSIKVGDVITLEVGQRMILDGDERYDLSPNNPFISDEIYTELLVDVKSYEFTVVGLVERPGYLFEGYSDPGYSFITVGLDSNSHNLYMAAKSTKDIKNDICMLLGVEAKDLYYSEALYEFQLNNSLISMQNIDLANGTIVTLLSASLFVVCIIVFVSVYCIKNSFSISYSEKAKMMSMLKSIGCTKRQIRSILFKEANVLSIIAIPLGVFSGILASYILVQFLNYVLVKYIDTTILFYVNWYVIMGTAIVGYLTVLLSVLNVARLASKVTPIENIKNSDQIKINPKKLKTPKIISKLFGMGGELAYKNMKRSKKKYRTTVYSIATCIFVFICMNSFVVIMEQSTVSYYESRGYNVEVINYSESDLYNTDFMELIKDEEYSLSYFRNELYYKVDEVNINIENEQDMTCGIVLLKDDFFDEYLSTLGLEQGNVILNDTIRNDDKKFVKATKYNNLDTFESSMVYNDAINELISFNFNEKIDLVTKILPQGMSPYEMYSPKLIIRYDYFIDNYNFFDCYYETFCIQSDNANEIVESLVNYIDNNNIDSAYVNNYQEMIDSNNDAILLISVFLYGFIAVISLIGVTNIFNTIHSNITLRKREFASLKSIGMSSKEFNHMMNLETLFYCSKALVIGIVTGLVGNYIFNQILNDTFYLEFYLPTNAIVISIISVLILVYVIMRYSLKMIQKDSIIDTIRNSNI